MLYSISGSYLAKIRRLVEKNAGKVGDNNASAAGGIGISSEGVGPKGKVSLPPALETTPRPIGVEDKNRNMRAAAAGVARPTHM